MLELSYFRLVSMNKEKISRDVLLGTLSEFTTQRVENRQNKEVL